MINFVKYIKALEVLKEFRGYQAINNLFDMWCRARVNNHEINISAFRKYNYFLHRKIN